MTNQVNILLTVDWEADHGMWHEAPPDEEDYGGILVGTHGLTGLLDEFDLACTWLVECHAEHHDRDMIRLFPDSIAALQRRERDEIGAHIHWVRREQGIDRYPLDDTVWIGHQVAYATQGLGLLGVCPRSFRGGAFLRVPGLPAILEAHGYLADSTYTDPRVLRRLVVRPAQPYRSHHESVADTGQCNMVEFPTHFRITGKVMPRVIDRIVLYQAGRLARSRDPAFLTLYLHIDELTAPGSGRDEHADLDARALNRLRQLFTRLLDHDGVTFITMQTARQRYLAHISPGDEHIR